jgi:hypothetical protein
VDPRLSATPTRTGRGAAGRRNHGGAVASQHDCGRLHRHGALLISASVAASVLFQDDSLTMGPHRCAPRLRRCLVRHRGVGSESRQRRLAVRRRLRRPPMAGRHGGTTRSGAAGTSSLEEVPNKEGRPTAVIVVSIALLLGAGLVISQLVRLRTWLGKPPPDAPPDSGEK